MRNKRIKKGKSGKYYFSRFKKIKGCPERGGERNRDLFCFHLFSRHTSAAPQRLPQQGDQIVRSFAYWAIIFFGYFLKLNEEAQTI
jgi:hypothetical protein